MLSTCSVVIVQAQMCDVFAQLIGSDLLATQLVWQGGPARCVLCEGGMSQHRQRDE